MCRMFSSSSTTRMRRAPRRRPLSAPSRITPCSASALTQLLDLARLHEHEVLGQVGDPVCDALEVVRHQDVVGPPEHGAAVLGHQMQKVVQQPAVHAVHTVVTGCDLTSTIYV